MDNLERAIISYRRALAAQPIGHPNRPMSLINLADTVLTRFEQLGRLEDINAAVAYNREALALCPRGHQDHRLFLNNSAVALHTRYNQTGQMEDLEEAITYNTKVLALRPYGGPDRSMSLNNLASAVLTRYEQLGRTEDLSNAITYYREALTSDCSRYLEYSLSNHLAIAILARYNQSGRMEDLEDAIGHRSIFPDDPNRCSTLINRANAFCVRYDQLGKMEDLDRTIIYSREALKLSPLGHQYHSTCLNNLGIAVLARYRQSNQTEDLEEAITCHRKALDLRPLGHPDRAMSLNSLANAVLSRHQQLDKMKDLEETITCYQEALTLCPRGHPFRFIPLANLANAVLGRFGQSGNPTDLDESTMLYEEATNDLAVSFKDRFDAALKWADVARFHHHTSIIRAYSTSLRLLDRCLISYPDVDSQQKFLATAKIPKSLASDAAAAAIDAQDLEAAVELLDQGRAILWSKMEDYRYPLDQLRQVDVQLADQFANVSAQLLALSSGSGPVDTGWRRTPDWYREFYMQRCVTLSDEWEKLIKQIRKIEGFTNFLQAIPFNTLRTAAAEGPIILVNISTYRSDAIILHTDKPPILVTLPNVQPERLARLCRQLSLAQKPETVNPSDLFRQILRDLWSNIVSPVHDCLTQLAVPPKSRIWWCLTCELCALPLHAAGPYYPKQRNLPDIYTSSYIPTVSALITARSNMVDQPVVPKLLIVGQPDEILRNVHHEIDIVRQLGDFVDVLAGADANRDTVLHGLQQHAWAHFACHGRLGDNSQPFHASFQLYNDGLTLLDLIQARLPNAELAFLSACHSAAGDLTTPDETIHLAAALQFCGFRSVVGTLWAMEDEDGPTISREFYKHMFRNPGNKVDFRDSAEALNVATRAMRRNHDLERWIMFVHIGA